METGDLYSELQERYKRAKSDLGVSLFSTRQVRDLTVIELLGDLLLVIAVDSDGGIGPKPDDVVKVSGYVCGRFGTRVPLMEVLACGAVPVAAFDSLAVEMVPTGSEILRGVRDELMSVGLPEDFPLSGSTEDNVPTRQTGMGVVIAGIVSKEEFRPGTAQGGDHVVLVGLPKSGPDDTVRLDDPEIADGKAVWKVSRIAGVHDMLPVGSKGVLYEARQLVGTAGLTFLPEALTPVNLLKSAGPSTCFLASGRPGILDTLRRNITQPVSLLGVTV